MEQEDKVSQPPKQNKSCMCKACKTGQLKSLPCHQGTTLGKKRQKHDHINDSNAKMVIIGLRFRPLDGLAPDLSRVRAAIDQIRAESKGRRLLKRGTLIKI
ncbi:recombination protein RecR [Striga asiatica]|uniref:Recombination protein RecR n=1 Tax=Striga asiatica TaxID=4170 RepID=A0A5A7QUX5_STRAF|nr:recombination protein RecR [Striga asiatica]